MLIARWEFFVACVARCSTRCSAVTCATRAYHTPRMSSCTGSMEAWGYSQRDLCMFIEMSKKFNLLERVGLTSQHLRKLIHQESRLVAADFLPSSIIFAKADRPIYFNFR